MRADLSQFVSCQLNVTKSCYGPNALLCAFLPHGAVGRTTHGCALEAQGRSPRPRARLRPLKSVSSLNRRSREPTTSLSPSLSLSHFGTSLRSSISEQRRNVRSPASGILNLFLSQRTLPSDGASLWVVGTVFALW